MTQASRLRDFLRNAHIFASTVREILEEKCLRESTDLDLSFPQLTLVQLISNNGDHQVGDIANFFGISPAAASKMVDKLVRLGLINRTVKEHDRRAVSLGVTPQGRSLVGRYQNAKRRRVERLLDNLSPRRLERVSKALERSSYLLLKQEDNFGEICLKCSSLYAKDCAIKDLHEGCLYVRHRKQAGH